MPIGPETTCIGPVLSSRQAPALILVMPLRPVGKQRRMPREQPLGGERLVVVARGVEHHFDDAFDVAVGGLERADIHAEAAGDRGADLFGVEFLAFDFAALEDIGGQGLQTASCRRLNPSASMWPISRPCR